MFTGIIQKTGHCIELKKNDAIHQLWIQYHDQDIELGQSMAIDGVCFTIAEIQSDRFRVDVLDETIRRTIWQFPKNQRIVNLEKSARLGDEIGGHIVTGHVDGISKVISMIQQESDKVLKIEIPEKFRPWVISKGCISINGVSLTVVDPEKDALKIHLIPFTLEHTNLSLLKEGDYVNVEYDQTAKYLHQYFEQMMADRGLK